MRKHTGQHILSRALVSAAKTDTVSAHLGESESTIELDREDISDEQLAQAKPQKNATMPNGTKHEQPIQESTL